VRLRGGKESEIVSVLRVLICTPHRV